MWLVFAACSQTEPGTDPTPTVPTDDTDPTSGIETGTPPTDPPTTACEATNTITALTATPGPITTMLEVAVTLSEAAGVAVQCAAVDEPEQVFFVESTAAATDHVVRLSGLVPRLDYTCSAAAVCPSTAAPETFEYTTDAAPSAVKRLDVTIDPKLGMDGAWTLAPFTTNIFAYDSWLVIWGPDGRPRWWTELPTGVGMWVEARYDLGEGTIVWGGGMDNEGRVRILDLWEGETFAFAPAGWQTEEFHHDGKRIADGRLMTLEIRENSAGASNWDGFGLRIVDPATGNVDVDFDSQVLVDDGVLEPGGGFSSDPWHANWMDYIETSSGPKMIVSLCLSFQIVQIDATTGQADWLLGEDLGWTVLDAQGGALPESSLPECQHGLEADGDKLLVYDNGQFRNQSIAQEWQIDGATKTATLLWSWTEAGWSEDYLGDIDYLPNDRVLVTQATMFGVGDIVEVDRATGGVASRMSLNSGGYTYRSDRYDGCDLFTSALDCPDLKTRYDALAPLLLP
jgi:Arylsulfotransferase (ASST)